MMFAFSHRCRVLLIEGYPESRAILRLVLEEEAMGVGEATSFRAGVRQARARRPDVIVADLAIPGTDAREAARQLRSDPATEGVPLIAAVEPAGTDARALETVFDRVLLKPVDPRRLVEAVREVTS